MKDKKGVALTMQTLILAALGLLILVLLVVLLVRQTNITGSTLNSCDEKGQGYECQPTRCQSGYTFYSAGGCKAKGDSYVCCVSNDDF